MAEVDVAALADALVARMGLPPHVDAVFHVMQSDPHQWSTRPCATCRVVTAAIGRPFGCDLYRAERRTAA